MRLRWTPDAQGDLRRLHAFLVSANSAAATRTVATLRSAALRLRDQPRIGPRLERYPDREVRRLIVGAYEIRYEVRVDALYVIRVFHTRENR